MNTSTFDPTLTSASLAASLRARPVICCESLRDGTVYADRRAIIIGTRPLDPIEAAGREGRLIVRRGMADVLAWLGEPVNTEPSGAEILAALRRHAS